jgi:NarL family two-component system response regulator LiaR
MLDAKPIRVVLVDGHAQIHEIVHAILSATSDIKLVGQGTNGREGIALCEQYQPDVALMDIVMPEMDGIETTKVLHERFPFIKVLVLSSSLDHTSVYGALRNGAVGYLIKGSLAEDLADTIRTIHQGKMVFSAEVVTELISPQANTGNTNFHLTGRELEVLALMAEGLNMPKIAARLTISQSTVKFHIENICYKLGGHTRSEALVVAAKNNLV